MAAEEAKRDGRRARGEANDSRIVAAAREVFSADPEAPIAAVAARAGVGINALYRRYGNKEGLVRALCEQAMERYQGELDAALADPREAPTVLVDFLRRVVDADTHALALNLAGTFEPDQTLWDLGAGVKERTDRFYGRMKAAGALREDVTSEDFAMIFQGLAVIEGPTRRRTKELRDRHLMLILDALTTPSPKPLPYDPLSTGEMVGRWVPPPAGSKR